MESYIFDIETDDLNATRIHCLSLKATDKKKIYTLNGTNIVDRQHIRSFFEKPDRYFIGHNVMSFDIPTVERLIGVEINRSQVIDTLYLSWYLFPKRSAYSLESFSPDEKVQVADDHWKDISFEDASERCIADVNINQSVWDKCQERLNEIYSHNQEKINKCIKYLMFKANMAAEAEGNGWMLDKLKAQANLEVLTELRDEKFATLESAMPHVQHHRIVTRPKVMFKKDGSLSALGEKWYISCEEVGEDPDSEEITVRSSMSKPNAGSVIQVKDWLFGLGWKPDEYKRNKKGGLVPQINSQDPDRKGEVSDSVLELADLEPEAINALSDLSIAKHRVGILEGFLDKVREDGRISARMGGLTNTLRFTHAGAICNLPSADGKFGELVRPCLAAPKGKILLGADVSSLEDRTKQHYMWPYDPEYVKSMQVEGFDPHLDLAVFGGAMTNEEAAQYKAGHAPQLKPIRYRFKTANYTCTYGAGVPRIAETVGCDHKEAGRLHAAYWKRNWAIKEIASSTKVMITKSDTQMWQENPVNGLWYELRAEKDRFSTLNQGTGSYAFDVWLGYCVQKLKGRAKLLAQFHDEFVFECDETDNKEELTKIVRDCMISTNRVLKLNRDLECDVQFGKNYGEIH